MLKCLHKVSLFSRLCSGLPKHFLLLLLAKSIHIDIEKTNYNDTVIWKPHFVSTVSHSLKYATESHFIFAFMRNLQSRKRWNAILDVIYVPSNVIMYHNIQRVHIFIIILMLTLNVTQTREQSNCSCIKISNCWPSRMDHGIVFGLVK